MNKIFGTQVFQSMGKKIKAMLVSSSSGFQEDRKIKSFSLASDITIGRGGAGGRRKFC